MASIRRSERACKTEGKGALGEHHESIKKRALDRYHEREMKLEEGVSEKKM